MGIGAAGAAAIAAGASAAGGIASSAMQAGAAGSAAQAQAGAAREAAQLQMQQYQQTRQDLLPFMTAGQGILPQLTTFPGQAQTALSNQWNAVNAAIPQPMTQAQLEQTPGYQFNLSQGLKATQNAAAARGLGVSGAALKGAGQFATGLADNTYLNQFNMAQQKFADTSQQFSNLYNQQGQGYNQLLGIGTLGANAAAQSGQIGQQGAAAAGGNIAAAGQAIAAGDVAQAKAISSGVNALTSAPTNYFGLQQFMNGYATPNAGGAGGAP